jgi:probable addiction module antidote protein
MVDGCELSQPLAIVTSFFALQKPNFTDRVMVQTGKPGIALMAKTHRPNDDPEFACAYLQAAFEEAHLPGGQQALIAAMRQIAEAHGVAQVAEKAGMPRESVYRALSPRGNPTLKTLLSILNAQGLRLTAVSV